MTGTPALAARLTEPRGRVLLYATAPPREGADAHAAAEQLAARIERLPVHGVVIYDLQDEGPRNPAPRPFPFAPHVESRAYAARVARASAREIVCYKCVGGVDEAGWRRWLDETAEAYGLELLSLVGRPSSRAGARLPLSRAFELAASHPKRFVLGGVAIAERHGARGSESSRMLEKAASGCRFFVTQTVYDAELTLRLLEDYAADCRRRGIAPGRVLLGFAPCGGPRTLEFMKWLGIAFAPQAEAALSACASPLARSIEICRDNLRRILAGAPPSVPLGVAVESVSTRREEADASADLVQALSEVL